MNKFVKCQTIICNLLVNINYLGNFMYTFNKKVVDSNFYTYIKENYSIVNSKNIISIIISYYYKNRFV